jgi:hypothetical protein
MPIRNTEPVVLRARSAPWLTGMVWLIAAVSAASAWASHGGAGLLQSWPLLAAAYVAWWLAWFPAVVVSDDGVTLRNPVRTVDVPWRSLVTVDTKYALTLVTASARYSAWSAPAPGLFGVQRAQPDHVRGLPETTYGPAGSVRPGDLSNSDSGTAAYYVRQRWAALLASGAVEQGAAEASGARISVNWAVLAAGAALVAAAVFALAA